MKTTTVQDDRTITVDHVDAYFDCLTLCDSDDGHCYERCVLVHLKQDKTEQ